MNKKFEKAIAKCTELLEEFNIGIDEWILIGPHADLLNGYKIVYHRPTHFHVLLERDKIPWKISEEQKDLIEVIPPSHSKFQKRYERYMTETNHDFDFILSPKPLKQYNAEIERCSLSENKFFQRMKPLGNVGIQEYIFSQFSPDKLERPDVALYAKTLMDEAKKRGEAALIEATRKFEASVSKRERRRNRGRNKFFNKFEKTGLIKGSGVFIGKVNGVVRVIEDVEINQKKKILGIVVMPRVSPKIIPAIAYASAWIVDEGGILSHAAVLSRELKIPCIIGTKIATKVLKDGMIVEVDANKGVVKILERG